MLALPRGAFRSARRADGGGCTMWRWLTTGIAVAALLLGSATTAQAADLDTEVGELLTALQARIDAGAGGKELKQLDKVVKKINKKPDPSVNDLRKILSGVGKSGTADQAVLDEAADVLQCLCDVVNERAELVASEASKIVTQTLLDKLAGKVASAQDRLELAKSFLESDPVKATKLLVGAAKKYEKALKVALKFVQKDAPKPPPVGIAVSSGLTGVFFVNNTNKPHNLKDILLDISLRSADGKVIDSFSASAKRLIPENFSGFNNRVFPGTFYDILEYVYEMVPPPGSVQGVSRIRGNARVLLGSFAPFDVPIDQPALGF
jgi:hypothetical protein